MSVGRYNAWRSAAAGLSVGPSIGGEREGGGEREKFIDNQTERECCSLVLNSATSTPRWIRQPGLRDMHDVCVLVCQCEYLCSKSSFSPSTQ
jgi:hypothetical protein